MTALRKGSFLSTEELSAVLGLSKTTVTKWCRDGTVPSLKVGHQWRIPANFETLRKMEECYANQK